MPDSWNAIITEVEPVEPLPGPLHGKRLLVKDLIDTAGIRTTYGSKIYADHVPERTAPAVHRLVDAGAVVVGKANLHEFAWGVTSQNPWYGTVGNPRHPGKIAGVVLRRRRAEERSRPDPDGRRFPVVSLLRHRRADGDHRRGRSAHVVCAHRRA